MMENIHLGQRLQRRRGFSPIWALVVIVALVAIVAFVRWYIKSGQPDPDLARDLKPWKEWRLRESSEKPEEEISAEQPHLTETIRFDTNLIERHSNDHRGELALAIGRDRTVGGRWYGYYGKGDTRDFQIIMGDFAGKLFPAKSYRDETGQEDRSKLYFMAKGRFLLQEANARIGKLIHRAGDLYLRGWLTKQFSTTGEVTITSDEKYFEVFTWKSYRPISKAKLPL